MEDILKALLEAQSAGGRRPQQSGQPDILGEIMGGLIGGAMGGSQRQAPQAAPAGMGDMGDIMDILGTIMGGAQAPAQGASPENALGGLGGILGGILGGGQRNPLADILAEKTGLHPAIASAIVAFFLSKVMGGGLSGGRSGGRSSGAASPAGGQTLDLDHLLDMMDDDDGIDNHIAASAMPQELAEKTGIDEATATHGLQELVKILGGERRSPRPVSNRNTGLESLLDNWETD